MSETTGRVFYGFLSLLLLFGVWYFAVRPLQNSPSTHTYSTTSNVHTAVNSSGFDVGAILSSGEISCPVGNDVEGVYRNFSFEIFTRFEDRYELNVIVENSLRSQGVEIVTESSGSESSVFSGVGGEKNGQRFELFYTSNNKAVFGASTSCSVDGADYVRYRVE